MFPICCDKHPKIPSYLCSLQEVSAKKTKGGKRKDAGDEAASHSSIYACFSCTTNMSPRNPPCFCFCVCLELVILFYVFLYVFVVWQRLFHLSLSLTTGDPESLLADPAVEVEEADLLAHDCFVYEPPASLPPSGFSEDQVGCCSTFFLYINVHFWGWSLV